MVVVHSNEKIEYGDFQTPDELAEAVCRLIYSHGIKPCSILEPTCGQGSFLLASVNTFKTVEKSVGIDINPSYLEIAKRRLDTNNRYAVNLFTGNFFAIEWNKVIEELPEPILIIGNPPWVTNAGVSNVKGSNLPEKSNFLKFSGFEALTGKSNFDISEWMLIKALDWMMGREATLAVLCKTSVARKIVIHAWNKEIKLETAAIYSIDAKKYFDAAVDACLLVLKTGSGEQTCYVYDGLESKEPSSALGYDNGRLIANITSFKKWKHLLGKSQYRWRSGVKHDNSKVMEFQKVQGGFKNGLDEIVDLELDYLYPMLKSSNIAKNNTQEPDKWMLVPQKKTGEETNSIKQKAPKTWDYLISHGEYLDGRKSSLYKTGPRFSIFGIGEYSFSPWKVAISGLYKRINFSIVGSYEDKPIVLDDTCYSLACNSEAEAKLLSRLLNSTISQEFFNALIFWDTKRPITVEILKQLDLQKLAVELKLSKEYNQFSFER